LAAVDLYLQDERLLAIGSAILALGGTWVIFSKRLKENFIKKIDKEEYDKLSYEERSRDPGYFSYEADGFHLKYEEREWRIRWTDIETLITYKKDNYTVDTIWLDIYSNGKPLSFSEELRGWRYFVGKLMEVLPQIDKAWENKVAFPAFAANYTLLYDKQGRSLEEIVRTWAKK
jgi:hypothetical protein